MTATGPRLENDAVVSSRSTAPTVSTSGTQPGEETVSVPEPALPAAMTNRVWVFCESCFVAWAIGSVQSPIAGLPKLMETTSACWSTAHCIPAMIQESRP